MILRKTMKTKQVRIYRGRYDSAKTLALYKVTTYWLLFIPMYSTMELVE